MAISWQFQGTFIYKPFLGTVCQNLLEKLSKKSVLVVHLCFLPNFSFIFGNMSDSCRLHGPFMALSWRFLPSDFYCFSKQFHGNLHVRFMALSWRFYGAFLALSWHFPLLGMFGFAMKVPWKCHESSKSRWNLHVRFMSICVCLFLSICRQCFFDVIFIDGFWGSGGSIFSGVFFDQNIGL